MEIPTPAPPPGAFDINDEPVPDDRDDGVFKMFALFGSVLNGLLSYELLGLSLAALLVAFNCSIDENVGLNKAPLDDVDKVAVPTGGLMDVKDDATGGLYDAPPANTLLPTPCFSFNYLLSQLIIC